MSAKDDYYQYIDEQLNNVPNLLSEYREQTKAWYFKPANTATAVADKPALFSMDKSLNVSGSSKTVGKNDGDYDVTTKCPQSGDLEIESAFQSIYKVPIGSIEVQVESVDGDDIRQVTLDAEGKALVTGLTPGARYRVIVDHKPTEAEMDALFSNYDELGNDMVQWLNGKWIGFKSDWDQFFAQSGTESVLDLIKSFLDGVWDGIKALWEGIGEIYDLLKDPQKALSDFGEGARDILDAISNAAKNAPDTLEKAMLFASDEAALYMLARGAMIYISMLPLKSALSQLAHMGGEAVAEILIGLIGSIIISLVATPAVGIGYLTLRVAKLVKKLGQVINRILEPIIEFFKELIDFVKRMVNKAIDKFKRIAINHAEGHPYQKGTVTINADNRRTSDLNRDNEIPDSSSPGKNPNGDSCDNVKNTKCKDDPISMVTGEELLSLQDGYLPGLLPFEWKRLYRTSAVEIQQGLGYGWTHTLAHQLWVEGDDIIWQNAESKQTRFPKPSKQLPVITNTMAGAAAFLGSEGQIAIVGEDNRIYLFELNGSKGKLIAIKDKYDHQFEIAYDGNDRPEKVTTATGMRYHLVYQDDLIEKVEVYHRKVIDELEQWVFIQTQASYQYNDRKQLVAVTNAVGETEHYTYDAQHVIQSRELAGGAIFKWEWQGEGKASRAIRQFSNIETVDSHYEWDDASRTVTVTNSDGTEQVYQHDENARLIKEVDAGGGEYLKEYDDKGRLVKEIDALGNSTEMVYNQAGELTAKVAPNGLVTKFSYRKGHISEVTQEKASWRYEYDDLGHLKSQVDPLGQETRYRYNQHGLIEQIHHPDGTQHKLVWNLNGELVSEQTPQGETIRYRYDILGRLRYRQDGQGVTEMHYDAVGRLTRHVLPGGKVRTYQYNAYGKVTEQTDELGRTTQYEYAWPLHQVTRKINPDGSSVQYRYDNPFNFVSQITNERGEQYKIEYAPTGHVKREQTFDGRQLVYEYDAHTQMIAKTEIGTQGGELKTLYAYDALGNVVTKTLPDGQEVQYQYDLHGRLTLVDDGNRPLFYRYDLLGQLTEEHQGWATTGYSYDSIGNLSRMVLPDGQVVEHHFEQGRLSQVDLNGVCLTQHQYQSNGLETHRSQGAMSSSYRYDEMGRLLEHRASQQHQQKLFRRYEYNQTGNLTRVEDNQRGHKEFYYDPLDRLTQVRGEISEQFAHDPAGNLLQERKANIQGNQLLFQGDRHYQYDEFGRLSQEARGTGGKLVTQYQYDSQHCLIQVSKPDGSKANYRYDAFGRRIEKLVTNKLGESKTTEFLWQGDKLLAESGDGHYQTYLYEYGTFKPLALIEGEGPQAAKPYFYHLDQIGTPLELTGTDGELAWSVDYKAYGNVALKRVQQINSPLRFQGQYFDEETGLHYNRHRYYSPDTGRYTTADPIGLAGGLNNYQYVVNPTGWVDPLGLEQCSGNCAGNYVYRALTPEQEVQALNNEPILPKDPNAGYSIQEHIDDGKLKTQYISTTKKLGTAEFYARPAPRFGKMDTSKIVKIDLDKIDKTNYFDVSNGINPQTGNKLDNPAFRYAKKDKEVLLEFLIPTDAYEVLK